MYFLRHWTKNKNAQSLEPFRIKLKYIELFVVLSSIPSVQFYKSSEIATLSLLDLQLHLQRCESKEIVFATFGSQLLELK